MQLARRLHVGTQRSAAPSQRGFTLIEMLVVMVIISVLASLLLPVISRSREMAKTTACSSNMRQIGEAMALFASDNEGRWPGTGQSSTGSKTWTDILNDYMPGDAIHHFGLPVPKGKMFCPSVKIYSTPSPRAYMMSLDASGGDVSGSDPCNTSDPGPYGKLVDAPPGTGWPCYRLGAPSSLAERPGFQFLVTETARAADYISPIDPTPDGMLESDLGDSAQFPPWSAKQGYFAFRHNLRANFLFFDLHVESLSPTNNINSNKRLAFNL